MLVLPAAIIRLVGRNEVCRSGRGGVRVGRGGRRGGEGGGGRCVIVVRRWLLMRMAWWLHVRVLRLGRLQGRWWGGVVLLRWGVRLLLYVVVLVAGETARMLRHQPHSRHYGGRRGGEGSALGRIVAELQQARSAICHIDCDMAEKATGRGCKGGKDCVPRYVKVECGWSSSCYRWRNGMICL